MSAPENVFARWSRRKLDSAREKAIGCARTSQESSTAETMPPGTEAVPDAPPDINAPVPEEFDPASLPSIDSITASSDIRLFLRSEVPEALTRSALRRAWVTDPAIRDFIGIAENQWDFNDPTAMPGFGPLHTDEVARLAERMLGSTDDTIKRVAEACAPSPQEAVEPKLDAEQCGAPVGESNARR